MSYLSVVILAFVVLETLNIFILYFVPGTKKGNGMGVFNALEKAKKDPVVYALVRYLINWVAGTKLIFISLLLVILFKGDNEIKAYSVLALVLSIFTFYWRLYPILRAMDKNKQLSPSGYSKTIGMLIAGFVLVFAIALLFYWNEPI